MVRSLLPMPPLLALTACGDGDDCRFDPLCPGGNVGASCEEDRNCAAGFCCDTGNCGGGMCTFPCDDDDDCPSDMSCAHDVCFFRCGSDRDCADGMSCEHGHTIREWE